MTLAEIIEKGGRLEANLVKTVLRGDGYEWRAAKTTRDAFVVEHGRTLLAVAKAAVEAERLTAIFQRDYITAPPDADSTAWTQRAWVASGEADDAIEKLFAAVRGEGKEKG